MKRNWFNLQLLSDGEIPIEKVNVVALISLLKGHKFSGSQVCHDFDNKQFSVSARPRYCGNPALQSEKAPRKTEKGPI